MIISHDLNSNGYLINNEIWFNINADSDVVYFKLILMNLSNSKISTQFISYADPNNNSFVNIQSVVKSLFDVPNGGTNNSTKIQISITANDGTNITFLKDFMRGGNRVIATNKTISPNQTLRLSEKLPVWSGFPAYDYFLSSSYVIQEQTLAEISNIDYKRVKGCNNVYLKFLNQKGGYSYWLFESYTKKETNTPLGYIINGSNNMIDLGSESNNDLQIYSKIPKEYKQYVLDVIVSPDIYAYRNGLWEKIFMKSNSNEYDNIKKVYTVNINIDLNYRFNPSLLWSN
jgi:hypothetical protein